jgi:hypothetical protein
MAASQDKTREMLAAMSKTNPKYSREGNVRECITVEMAKHYERSVLRRSRIRASCRLGRGGRPGSPACCELKDEPRFH